MQCGFELVRSGPLVSEEAIIMTIGLSVATFTLLHVLISLISLITIACGVTALFGIAARRFHPELYKPEPQILNELAQTYTTDLCTILLSRQRLRAGLRAHLVFEF